MYVDNRTSTFECCWSFQGSEVRSMNALAEYQNEKLFFAQILGDNDGRHIKTPLIRFFFVKPRNCGFKISEITMSHRSGVKWIRMKRDQQEKEVIVFTAKMLMNVCNDNNITFRIKITSKIKNCGFDIVDAAWSDLWSRKQFTDVDILVGQNKLQAHRVVLSARSAVFNTLLGKVSTTGKFALPIGADEVDFAVVEQFLKYLYTGTLSISANNKQLLALAEMYQVETLKEICQLAVRVSVPEDVTTSFLAII